MVEKEKSEDKENKSKEAKEEEKDDFFIGETKLATSPNFKPVRNSLEKMITKEMFEEAFPEEFKRDDEEEIDEVYVPVVDEESYNEVREEENSHENALGSEFYEEKKDRNYSEEKASKDGYAPVIRSNEVDNKRDRDSPIFHAGLSEEMRQSRKDKLSLN